MPPPRHIVAIPGDGIGPEVMHATRVLGTTAFANALCKRIQDA